MFWGLIQTKKDKRIKSLESSFEKLNCEVGKYLYNNNLWLSRGCYWSNYTYVLESLNQSHNIKLEEKQREDEIRRVVNSMNQEQNKEETK